MYFTLAISAACLIISQVRFETHDPALWPFLEQWITGDKREHHLLDRPRNAPSSPDSHTSMSTRPSASRA